MRIETTSLAGFSHRGAMMALGTKSKILDANFSPGSTLQVLDTDTEEVIFKKQVPSRFNRLEWGNYPENLFLVGGLDSGNITMWDATPLIERNEPHELVFTNYSRTEDDILGIDFSPGMPILATGSAGGRVVLWNMRTLDKPLSPGGSSKYEGVSCVQWNKNIPQILAVGTTDGAVGVLDLRGKSEVAKITGPYFARAEITSLQWNPSVNTQMAVSSSSSQCTDVMLYDLRVTKGSPCLKGHTDGILKCVWSEEDPSLIVTCSRDGTIMAWNAKTLEKRGVLLHETVFDFGFNPEYPDTIVYSSFNGEVVVDSITSLNASSPFLDEIPRWYSQGSSLCFIPEGLVYFDKELKLHPWASSVDTLSYEWKVLDALEKETPREEMLSILSTETVISSTEEIEEGVPTVEMDVDEPITERIIQGNIAEAFKSAVKENAALAALVALCSGPEVLKKEKNRILCAPGASSALLLLISILTGAYNDLVDKNVNWKVLAKIVGKHCTDEEFAPKMHCIAETLEEKGAEGANICYLISKDLKKYQEIEEKRVAKPTSIYEAMQFYEEFGKTFSVIERAALLMNEKVSAGKSTMNYLQYLIDKGESERVSEFTKSLTEESAVMVKEKLLKIGQAQSSEQPTRPTLQHAAMRPPIQPPPAQPLRQNTPFLGPPTPSNSSWPVTQSPFPRPSTPMNATAPQTPTPPPVQNRAAPKIAFVKTQAPATTLSSALETPKRSGLSGPSTPSLSSRSSTPMHGGVFKGPAVAPPSFSAPPAQPSVAPPAHPPHLVSGQRAAAPPLHPSVFPTQKKNASSAEDMTPSFNSFSSQKSSPSFTPTQKVNGNNFFSPFPAQNNEAAPPKASAPEVKITPEMESVYRRMAEVIDALVNIINNKKGSLKNWLLKTVQPKIDVLRKHIADKTWPPEFLMKMSNFLEMIEKLGIHKGATMATIEELEEIRKEGDKIVASRPAGTGIEVWISAIYSLLKVALH